MNNKIFKINGWQPCVQLGEAASVTEYINYINILRTKIKQRDEHFKLSSMWFRGEPKKYKFPLLPKIFRLLDKEENAALKEHAYLHTGINMLYSELHSTHIDVTNIIHRLSLLQHYGAPTRLLDWTLNPLVALYFLIRELFDHDGYIYILEPRKINNLNKPLQSFKGAIVTENSFNMLARLAFIIEPKDYYLHSIDNGDYDQENLYKIWYANIEQHNTQHNIQKIDLNSSVMLSEYRMPVAISAPWLFPRMRYQLAMFTLHGGFVLNDSQYSAPHIVKHICNKEDIQKTVLYIIRIPSSNKRKIKEELYYLGINRLVLFGDNTSDMVSSLNEIIENA